MPSFVVGCVKCMTCCWLSGGKQVAIAGCVVCIQTQSTSCGLVASWCSWANCPVAGSVCCCIAHFATASASSFQACPWWPLTSWMVALGPSQRPKAPHSLARGWLDLHVVEAVATVRLRERSGRIQNWLLPDLSWQGFEQQPWPTALQRCCQLWLPLASQGDVG